MGTDEFDLEPSSHEPDEWDPEAELHDSTTDGLTIPSVSTAETDAPKEVVRSFWTVVIVVNVAVLFVSLGPMLIYFRGDVRYGLALLVGGVVLFGLAYRRYRRFMRETDPDSTRDGATDDEYDTGEERDASTDRVRNTNGESVDRGPTDSHGESTDDDQAHENSS